MATRFSASEARLKAEKAQKTLEEQRKREKELKKNQAKERVFVKAGFENQSRTIISAAIDGKVEVELGSVFLFHELVELGVMVVEEGLVKRQPHRRERDVDTSERELLKEQILEHFDKFIDDAKGDLKGYYGGLQIFHRQNYDALYESINSDWGWNEFSGDDVFFEEVPYDLKEKYSDYFVAINEKIREYRDFIEEDDEFTEFDENELITGEYFFNEDDEELDVLKPSVEGNKLKIRWASEQENTFMNAPLLSGVGLAWLSSYRGQSLIELVFEALSDAAERGHSSHKLDFSLTSDGWYFLFDGRKIYCCIPDELVEIIARESFSIDDTSSSDRAYSIKVSW